MIMNRKSTIVTAAISLLFLLGAMNAFAFKIAIPEDISKLPEEEQNKWLNEQMDKAWEEQQEVGKERYESRMKEKQEVAESLVAGAQKSRRLIREAAAAAQRRESESLVRSQGAFLFIVILGIPALLFWMYYRQKNIPAEIPEKSPRDAARESLETSQALMQRLKKKDISSPPHDESPRA